GIYDFPEALRQPGSNRGLVELWWHRAYLGPRFAELNRSPLVSPVYAPRSILKAFPPTYLSVGSEDSLVGQSLAMARALAWENVPVTLSVLPGVDHAFSYLEHALPGVTPEFERIFVWLRQRTG
ncbi:MAG: alpha/beta hydrolase, partial [Acidimicrobiia bacterium]